MHVLGRQLAKQSVDGKDDDCSPHREVQSEEFLFFDAVEDADEGPFGHDTLFDEEVEDEATLLMDNDCQSARDDGGSLYLLSELLPVAKPAIVTDVLETVQKAFRRQPAQVSEFTGKDTKELLDEMQRRGGDTQRPARQATRLSRVIPRDHTSHLSITAAGKFEKRSPWWVEGWRSRSYVLKDARLLFFNSARPDRPLGVIDFRLVRYALHCCWERNPCQKDGQGAVSISAEDAPELPHRSCDGCMIKPANYCTFFLVPLAFRNKVFAFRGPEVEMGVLVENLITIISAELQLKLNNPYLEKTVITMKDFWRYPFIKDSEFLERVESGDILLFRGKDRRCALTRVLTLAEYDHVALMLRTDDREVLILEATGQIGVDVIPWHYFKQRGWHKCYDRLAYRKVYFSRTTSQLHALQNFVCSVLGTDYKLNLNKLFVRKLSKEFDEDGNEVSTRSSTPGGDGGGSATPEERVSVEDESSTARTFFCSELVAACLKRCGVLAGARASSQYWPGTFSQRYSEPLPMQPHAFIGEEQIIVCD